MTRAASAVAFRVLLVAVAAAVLYLDMTLGLARTTRQLPVKASGDCSALPAAVPASNSTTPASSAPATAASEAPSVPPGFTAAFGSCGEAAASPGKDR